MTDSIFRTRRFWVTLAICAIVYLPSLFWSLGLDQNIFAEIGTLLLRGFRPYVDAWDIKPPNIFYTYGLFEWLFGQHEFAVRFADYIAALGACAAMYHFVRKITWLQRAPEAASILLALTLLSLGLADTAQTESFSLLFLLSAASLVVANDRPSKYFIAGILVAIATFYKTTNVLFLLPFIVEILIAKDGGVRKSIIIIAGLLVWSGLQIGNLALEGSLEEYLRIAQNVLLHHPNEVSQLSYSEVIRSLWIYVDVWSITIPVAFGIAAVERDRDTLRSMRLPFLLLLTGLLSVVLQNKGWGYQYVIVLPGLVALCGISSVYIYEKIRAVNTRAATLAALAAMVVTVLISPSARRRIHYTQDAASSVRDHSSYIRSLGERHTLYYPACTDSLATYLRTTTSSNDKIFIFGEEPGAYWRSNRLPASRFQYCLLFTSGVIPDSDLIAEQHSIIEKKPAVIVIERFDTLAFRGRPETSQSLVENDPVFATMRSALVSDYVLVDTVCDNFLIYRKK